MIYKVINQDDRKDYRHFVSEEAFELYADDPNVFFICAVDDTENLIAGLGVFRCDEISVVYEVNVAREYDFAEVYEGIADAICSLVKECQCNILRFELFSNESYFEEKKAIIEGLGFFEESASRLFETTLTKLNENIVQHFKGYALPEKDITDMDKLLSYELSAMSEKLYKQGFYINDIPDLHTSLSKAIVKDHEVIAYILISFSEETGSANIEYLANFANDTKHIIGLMSAASKDAMKILPGDTAVSTVSRNPSIDRLMQQLMGDAEETLYTYLRVR